MIYCECSHCKRPDLAKKEKKLMKRREVAWRKKGKRQTKEKLSERMEEEDRYWRQKRFKEKVKRQHWSHHNLHTLRRKLLKEEQEGKELRMESRGSTFGSKDDLESWYSGSSAFKEKTSLTLYALESPEAIEADRKSGDMEISIE